MDDRQDFVEAFKGYWSDPAVDALATERVSYFDPSRLKRAVATRPTSWPRLLRSRFGH